MLKLPHSFTHLTHWHSNAQNFQTNLEHYVNYELPYVQAGFRKGRGTRDEIANIYWIIKKARELQENHLIHKLCWKALTLWITINWKILKEIGIPTIIPVSWETCKQIKKKQSEKAGLKLNIPKN